MKPRPCILFFFASMKTFPSKSPHAKVPKTYERNLRSSMATKRKRRKMVFHLVLASSHHQRYPITYPVITKATIVAIVIAMATNVAIVIVIAIADIAKAITIANATTIATICLNMHIYMRLHAILDMLYAFDAI
ncbi:hypothetical protein V6N11_043189 [Hibiscus sabdariffa]|uniref:Uncharacterized protein n=1 Tax=Hibiscus sabdariffa TaxID=183260 RepID=A0ABR2QZ41_9ROSI